MIQATEIFYFVLGVLTLLGGIVSYIKAKRLPTLILGIIFGLVLITAGFLMLYAKANPDYLKPSLILGLLATAALAGQFIPKIMMNRAAPNVIVMAILSGVGMILTLIVLNR